MQGENITHLIENLKQNVRENGRPIIINNQGTIELINKTFTFSYDNFINMEDINRAMKRYYFYNDMDIDELQELEKTEYEAIENELYNKFNLLDDDLYSRRVLWTDDCCISMVHYLIRDKTILCFVHLRSSDVVYKLFSDLALIHKITAKLQKKLNIKNTIISINAHSLHEIVISQVRRNV